MNNQIALGASALHYHTPLYRHNGKIDASEVVEGFPKPLKRDCQLTIKLSKPCNCTAMKWKQKDHIYRGDWLNY